ncbi:MAG TPA: U32 family peptidase [Alphaproteobacteria bacterium]|nr:U32 family peptidase [Alphaproteobacteria bacterium]
MTAALSLGPLLYNWPAEDIRDFYFRIADEAALERVYLGEVVCSKRTQLFERYLPEVAERLGAAGKEVVHSTLALIMSEREMDAIRSLAEIPDILIEANDIGSAALLAGRPHVIGPFVNVYNEDTLEYLARHGAGLVSLPWELPAPAIAALAKAATIPLEVQIFGRIPLAISARCYHARRYGLHKDGCQYVCADDPDGMAVETLDGEDFLAVNGTQTLSHTIGALMPELADLRENGIQNFRLWPHAIDMVAVAQIFRDLLDGRKAVDEAWRGLADIADLAPFSNGFYHDGEGAALVRQT